ncbi:MAG: cell division protein FtsA [Armatimonadetes bacterium]|nr:cell division protein FtsA [Armatimonadota bacterium]
MRPNDQVAVVDLGTSKVACLVANVTEEGKLAVESLAYAPSQGVAKGEIVDADAAAQSVEKVVSKVERHLNRDLNQLWASISGSHLQSQAGQGAVPIYPAGRILRRQDIHQVIRHSRQQLMPPEYEQIMAVPREYKVDGERVSEEPVGRPANRLDVVTHIVTGNSDTVELMERTVGFGGRATMGLAPCSLASGLGVLSKHAAEMGAVVIDLGAGKTDLAIFVEGAYAFQSVIKVGADHVTSDIMQLLKTDWDEAERLKSEEATALFEEIDKNDVVQISQVDANGQRNMQKRVLCEIVGSRVHELAKHINQSLENSGFDQSELKHLVLTGGGALLPGIAEVFAAETQFKNPRIVQPRVAGKFAKQVASPTLSTIVGLARYALESGEQDLAPVSGFSDWKDRISTIKSWFSGKS